MTFKLLTRSELGERLRVSPQGISNRLHRDRNTGESLPPSIMIGSRRFWVESDVIEWLESKRSKVEVQGKKERGRPRKTNQEQGQD